MIAITGRKAAAAALILAATVGASALAWAANDEHVEIERQNWSFSGLLGHYDQAQLQRGFRVYKDVCSTCHGLKRIAFRNLVQRGGPEFPEAGVKTLAAENYKVDALPNEEGKIVKRPAILSDHIPSPYANEQEARASQPGGALPPDLSLIARARSVETNTPFYMLPLVMLRDIVGGYQEGGVDYVYAYLTGYVEAPADAKVPAGMSYNRAFPGHMTAMPNPLADGIVTYDDGTPETVDNYARDVTAFLAWAANPELEQRKRLGLLVMVYLLITASLLYFAKRRIWSRMH